MKIAYNPFGVDGRRFRQPKRRPKHVLMRLGVVTETGPDAAPPQVRLSNLKGLVRSGVG
jgi:hypothetical protein